MANDVEIVNRALIAIGADPILTLSQAGKNATTANRIYPTVRDALLGEHPWKFATKRVILAPTTNTPAYGWSYEFQLPTDFIRVQLVGEDEDTPEPFLVESDKILANTDSLYLKYTYRETNAGMYRSAFIEALAAKLAAELAVPLADDAGLAEGQLKLYSIKLSSARFADAQEKSQESLRADQWLDARG